MPDKNNDSQNNSARPFLKWAGGKSQLLDQIDDYLPTELKQGNIENYIEPFMGGGAVFFYLAKKYKFQNVFLYDINPELVLAYLSIQKDVLTLIERLFKLEKEYIGLTEEQREINFYNVRNKFNSDLHNFNFDVYSDKWMERTAEIIFLNRTCFNGLFRVNSKGQFNVPFGKYENPRICDAENLTNVAKLLSRANITKGDFAICDLVVTKRSFVYFDPPYRPLSITSSFNSYSRHIFNDSEQLRLADFYRDLDKRGAILMLSNSDPKNVNPEDAFFENAYQGFRVERVNASRNINSKSQGRGKITELLILNY